MYIHIYIYLGQKIGQYMYCFAERLCHMHMYDCVNIHIYIFIYIYIYIYNSYALKPNAYVWLRHYIYTCIQHIILQASPMYGCVIIYVLFNTFSFKPLLCTQTENKANTWYIAARLWVRHYIYTYTIYKSIQHNIYICI